MEGVISAWQVWRNEELDTIWIAEDGSDEFTQREVGDFLGRGGTKMEH